MASWSDIPVELAGLVLRRLPAHVDRIRFAAVCPQWRVAARELPLPPPLPLLALPDGTVYSLPGSEPLRFPGCAGYADACGNWLAFSGEDGCFLRNPFSNATVTLPELFRVQTPHLGVGDVPVDGTGITWMEMEDTPEQLTMYKLVVCSPQLIATLVRFRIGTRIAVCQPGASSWWSVHMDCWFSVFVEMAFHQGKLYVLDYFKDDLFAIDISVDRRTGDPWVSRVQRAINNVHSPVLMLAGENVIVKMRYLVELHGALLMVCRKMYCRWKTTPTRVPLPTQVYSPLRVSLPTRVETDTVVPTGRNEFEVFKADFQQSKWTKVTTIGDDQVLFLRRRCSRFVCVSQMEMPGDRIVFLDNDDEDHDWYDEESSNSFSVYDMRAGKVSTSAAMIPLKRGFVPGTWLFPQD